MEKNYKKLTDLFLDVFGEESFGGWAAPGGQRVTTGRQRAGHAVPIAVTAQGGGQLTVRQVMMMMIGLPKSIATAARRRRNARTAVAAVRKTDIVRAVGIAPWRNGHGEFGIGGRGRCHLGRGG